MNAMDLLSLPPEVLEGIISFLPLKDIMAVSQTCQKFYELTQGNQFWAKVCLNQYNLEIPSTLGFAKKFYRNVLYYYGHLIGFWVRETEGFSPGGLLQILYADRQLRGVDLQVLSPSSNRTEPLRPIMLFNISIDEENKDEVAIKWCFSPDPARQKNLNLQYIFTQGPAKTVDGQFLHPPNWYLVTNKSEEEKNDDYGLYNQERRYSHLKSQNKLEKNDEFFFIEFENDDASLGPIGYSYRYSPRSHYSRLKFPQAPKFPVPIQPGMFTAISAWLDASNQHIKWTRELVLLSYDEGEKKVTGLLITGDFNVEAGKLSFQADLSHCIDQGKVTREVSWKDLAPRPFKIPLMFLEKFPDLPDQAIAKFQGFATPRNLMTGTGFVYLPPYRLGMMEEGQWIIFNKNVFGFLVTRGPPRLIIYDRVQDSSMKQQHNI